jgi:hypothetical protein
VLKAYCIFSLTWRQFVVPLTQSTSVVCVKTVGIRPAGMLHQLAVS